MSNKYEDAKYEFTNYADRMLLNVADELNIKEVRLSLSDNPKIEAMYCYDTLTGFSKGFSVVINGKLKEAPDTLQIVLIKFFSGNVIEDMEKIRGIINIGLRERTEAGIKVRQPLQSVTIKV